jgi:hypothetical protein
MGGTDMPQMYSTLEYDFSYSEIADSQIGSEGVLIDKSLTINGNGHEINGNNITAFKINNPSAIVTFNDIVFVKLLIKSLYVRLMLTKI